MLLYSNGKKALKIIEQVFYTASPCSLTSNFITFVAKPVVFNFITYINLFYFL